MKNSHIFLLISFILGIIIFIIGAVNDIMLVGIAGFLTSIAVLVILLFTTKTGITVLISSGIIIIMAILIFFGPVRLTYEIKDIISYYDNKDSVVEVSAIVTNISESTDGEGGTDYSAYVSYSYNNKSYSNVYWKRVSSDFEEFSEVKIKIAPKEPGRVFRSGTDHYTSLFFPLIITLFFIIAIINLPMVIYKEYKTQKTLTADVQSMSKGD